MHDSLNDILNRVSDAFMALDKNYCYTYVNKRNCEMVQKSAEELIGRNVWEVFPDAVGSKTYLAIIEAMEQQHFVSSIDYYAPLDLWQENSIYPSPDGLSIFIRDISAQKRSEKALVQNETRYLKLIENTFDAVILLDDKYKVIYQSPSAEKITGWTFEERKGQTGGEMSHPDDAPLVADLFRNIIKYPGKELKLKSRAKHKSGHFFWMETSAINLLHDDDVKGLLFNIKDITAQVEYEEKLIKSKRLYAFISQVNQTIVYTTEREKLFESVCEIAHEFGHFDRAWIGMINDAGSHMDMVAQYGIPDDEIALYQNVDLQAPEMESSALHFAVIRGQYAVINDTAQGSLVPIWVEMVRKHGIKSLGIFPIKKFGTVVGVMAFLISTPVFFDEEEIALLVEAVGDVSFALELFDKEDARKIMEEQLAQSESLLSRAQQIANLGSWVYDIKADRISWSEEIFRILGLTPGEIRPHKRSIVERTHPGDLHLFHDLDKRLSDTQAIPSLHFRIIRPDGEVRYIHTDREFEFDHKGEPMRLVGILHDETERHEAEQKLINSEMRFRALIENNYDAITVLNENMEAIYRSPSSARIIGWSDDDLRGLSRFDFVHPDDLDAVQVALQECKLHPGIPTDISFRSRHKDGRFIWIEGLLNDLRHDENVKGYLLNFRDVTDRKEAEQKLVNSEMRFRTLIEHNYDAITLLDRDLVAIYRSPSAQRITGWSDADLAAKSRFDFIHAHDLDIARQSLTVAAAQPGTPVEVSFRFAHKDGHYIWVEGMVNDMIHDESIKAFIFNFRDITDRKKAEFALKELNDSLEQKVKERTSELVEANMSLDSFSYSVSHDLRSPLGNIMGFIKMIQMEYGEILIDDVKEMLLQMEVSARRMNAIIEDLLQLARFSREKLELQTLDLEQMIHKVWANIKSQSGHNARLELMEIAPVPASESMMEQVMINLISNAVKYSSKVEAPVVTIGSKVEDGVYTIFIKDNGIGFDMQYYSRLFKPFQRLHISSDFEGTGIGLTLVKRIIEKHNGKIWAESQPNEGATFYFTIPL